MGTDVWVAAQWKSDSGEWLMVNPLSQGSSAAPRGIGVDALLAAGGGPLVNQVDPLTLEPPSGWQIPHHSARVLMGDPATWAVFSFDEFFAEGLAAPNPHLSKWVEMFASDVRRAALRQFGDIGVLDDSRYRLLVSVDW